MPFINHLPNNVINAITAVFCTKYNILLHDTLVLRASSTVASFGPTIYISFTLIFSDTKSDFTKRYMADARKYIKENGFFRIDEFLKKTLERSKNSKIRIGIIGDTDSGKSAFINAIRG